MSFLCFGLAWAGRVAFDIETAPCPWTGYEFRTSLKRPLSDGYQGSRNRSKFGFRFYDSENYTCKKEHFNGRVEDFEESPPHGECPKPCVCYIERNLEHKVFLKTMNCSQSGLNRNVSSDDLCTLSLTSNDLKEDMHFEW